MENYDVTVILPALNEEERIENCVNETIKTFGELKVPFEIIIAENGSTDNTFKIATELSEKYSNLKAIHLDKPSIAGAFKKAYAIAEGKVLVNLDVDLATDMSHMEELLKYSREYDVVTGSRYLDNKIVNRTFTRLFLSTVFNWFLIRGLLGSKIKDNNCGFRALKKDVGIDILNDVRNNDVFGIVELMIVAQRKGYTIKEFPVTWTENPRKITINNIMRFLKPALQLWWRINFKKTK